MKNTELTSWFPVDVNPTHVGVYETRTRKHAPLTGYQYWNGRNWRFWGFTPEDAYECRDERSCFQKVQWRGLASKPKESK